ncbi:MAG: monomethylamine:corrinoid methyltransferase [Candidatus Methanomethylophilaceae archaeon]|nr:monomethylamine:corrinoid methyltransferase [Candidatus Methanomethylophilaceae archaeon]
MDVFEAYDRFIEGERVLESDWDLQTIPTNARLMRNRYDINFSKEIIPEDQDLVDRLFLAGVDMLLTTGFYNSDTSRVMRLTEDEIYEGIKMAPKEITLGSGKDKVECRARRGNEGFKPVIQGGPTGSPVSEDVFTSMIESYAQEPAVDTIVSGVLSSVRDHPAVTNSPWEIKATLAEIRYVRAATHNAGRPGLSI